MKKRMKKDNNLIKVCNNKSLENKCQVTLHFKSAAIWTHATFTSMNWDTVAKTIFSPRLNAKTKGKTFWNAIQEQNK